MWFLRRSPAEHEGCSVREKDGRFATRILTTLVPEPQWPGLRIPDPASCVQLASGADPGPERRADARAATGFSLPWSLWGGGKVSAGSCGAAAATEPAASRAEALPGLKSGFFSGAGLGRRISEARAPYGTVCPGGFSVRRLLRVPPACSASPPVSGRSSCLLLSHRTRPGSPRCACSRRRERGAPPPERGTRGGGPHP